MAREDRKAKGPTTTPDADDGYTDEPLGTLRVIDDCLPPPGKLRFKREDAGVSKR